MNGHGPVTITAAGITIAGMRPRFSTTVGLTSRRKAARDGGTGMLAP
jgi:hypothetical protein